MKLSFILPLLAIFAVVSVYGDSLTFRAAAPASYIHLDGGGAWNGGDQSADIRGSLNGNEYACGDVVTFFTRIEIDAGTGAYPYDVSYVLNFQGASTKQANGVGYAYITYVGENSGQVTNGGGVGRFDTGLDTAHNVAGTLTVTKESEYMNPGPILAEGSVVTAELLVKGLSYGDVAIIRTDVIIGCVPGVTPPNSGISAYAGGAWTVNKNTGAQVDSISGFGNANVPLQGLSEVKGLDSCYLSDERPALEGVSFTADEVTVTDPQTAGGYIIRDDFSYSWKFGAWKIADTGTNDYELHTFETNCTNDHDGEYLFLQADCPVPGSTTSNQCEETFIGSNQAQLFVEEPDQATWTGVEPYYNLTPEVVEIKIGNLFYTVHKYTANPNYWVQQAIDFLYMTIATVDTPSVIIRADWTDGRIMTFSGVTYLTDAEASAAWAAETFTEPTECLCRRDLDVVVYIDAANVAKSDLISYVQPFVKTIAGSFSYPSTHMGVYQYDDEITNLGGTETVSPLAAGVGFNSVGWASIGAGCANSGNCGTGVGDVVLAIDDAIAELNADGRAGVAGVIVIVTNDFNIADTANVQAAADRAAAAGYNIITVVHASYLNPERYEPLLQGNADNLLWAQSTEMLSDAVANELGIQLSSRMCLLDDAPCQECCGYCNSVCGGSGCTEIDDCPINNDCRFSYERTGLEQCCGTLVEVPFCSQEVDFVLEPCQEMQCNAETGECEVFSCSDLDNDCYTWTCDSTTDALNPVCTKQLPPATPCEIPSCPNDVDLVWTPVDCTGGEDICFDSVCNVTKGGCVYFERPPPSKTTCETVPPCDANLDAWLPVRKVCETLSTPCVERFCDPVTTDGTCAYVDLCVAPFEEARAADLCITSYTCDGVSGECSFASDVVCVDDPVLHPCERTTGCDSTTGECAWVSVDCTDFVDDVADPGNCRTFACDAALDACAVVPGTDADCFVCNPPCTDNECSFVPCEEKQCVPAKEEVTDCSTFNAGNNCLVPSCDIIDGCVNTPVDCSLANFPIPAEFNNGCFKVIEDTTFVDGCCRIVPVECAVGSDTCYNYPCDTSKPFGTPQVDVCITEFIGCPAPAFCKVYDGVDAEDSCVDGFCQFKDFICSRDGLTDCQTVTCNPTNGNCDVDSSACTCANLTPPIPCNSDKCIIQSCDTITVEPPVYECNVVSSTADLCPPNQTVPGAVCKMYTGLCDPLTGCEIVDKPCAAPADCEILKRDVSDADNDGECCEYTPIVCDVGVTAPGNKCLLQDGTCLNNECGLQAKPCDYVNCKENAQTTCDIDTGNCIYVPRECANTGNPDTAPTCQTNFCNSTTDACELKDDSACFECSCVENACFTTPDCLYGNICGETVPTTRNNECVDLNSCFTSQCVNSTGCVQTPVECPVLADKCQVRVRTPNETECCSSKPLDCPITNPCYNATECLDGACLNIEYDCDRFTSDCEVGVCTPDGCVAQPRDESLITCPVVYIIGTTDLDLCNNAICTAFAECDLEEVICTPRHACETASCDSTTGGCVYDPIQCVEEDKCQIYTCNKDTFGSTGVCESVPVNCDDSDVCTNEYCDSLTGSCVRNDVKCNDGFACTNDTCVSEGDVGCVYTPMDDVCTSGDPCKITRCDVESPDATVENRGCVYDNRECPDDGTRCSVEFCEPFAGCQEAAVDCRTLYYGLNRTYTFTTPGADPSGNKAKTDTVVVYPVEPEQDCDVHYCSDADGGICELERRACPVAGVSNAVIIGAALGTAAVVGIVVGIVVAVALCAGGAGVYSVYKNADDGATAVVASNPLYQQSGGGGENPLFRE